MRIGRGRGGGLRGEVVCGGGCFYRAFFQRRGDVVKNEKTPMYGFFHDGVIAQPAALFKQRQQALDGARVIDAIHAPVDVFILLVAGKIGGDGCLFTGDAVKHENRAGDGNALFGGRFYRREEFPGARDGVGIKAHQRGIFAAVVKAKFDVRLARRALTGSLRRGGKDAQGGGAKRARGGEQRAPHGRTQCSTSSGTR